MLGSVQSIAVAVVIVVEALFWSTTSWPLAVVLLRRSSSFHGLGPISSVMFPHILEGGAARARAWSGFYSLAMAAKSVMEVKRLAILILSGPY